MKSINKTCVVIPNWNGRDEIGACLDSLLSQSTKPTIVVVENGSIDDSYEFITKNYPDVICLKQPKNLGFAGGVNQGIKYAIENNFDAVALFNNDAVADKDWLSQLSLGLTSPKTGIATCKFVARDKSHLDSTGDMYTTWGLPYPRGRDETDLDKYDSETSIFGATGGASIYSIKMLKQIGLFDADFFAYYEDIDLSFRAQLAGWKVRYVPEAIAYHSIGATSSKIKGFTTYQTAKNLPWIIIKNLPAKYLRRVMPRFYLSYFFFAVRAVQRRQGLFFFKGAGVSLLLIPKKLYQRRRIQKTSKLSSDKVWALLVHDLPPNAKMLRKVRLVWWKITRRKV